ncbi:MAG: DUF2461 domain-containing protein [Bacteroidetes bacterium]|nr:MAG: DUF2461 domain-containing protein [Bacteroidota bacterium]
MNTISPKTLDFLRELKENNNKIWFEANKNRYQDAQQNLVAFIAEFLEKIQEIEPLGLLTEAKKCVFRIYRDVRFSKNKTPYKNNLGAVVPRGENDSKTPFYLHIEPNNCFVASGLWDANAKQLKILRREIDFDVEPLKKLINKSKFKKFFGKLEGESLKKAPKGFPTDHPEIELLKMKQMLIMRKFSNEAILSENLMPDLLETYQVALEFFAFIDEIMAEASEK